MKREELMQILPHRDGMLLMDEVTQEGDTACGRYHVRGDEWFLQGHFPGNPVVPGVMLCEMLAQSTCVLLGAGVTEGKMPLFTGLNKVRFRAQVKPGDTVETSCQIVRKKPPFYFAEGTGRVHGEVCVKAEFSFAVMGE